MKTRIFHTLILAALAVCSCGEPMVVTDHSFTISSSAFFSEEDMSSRLVLTLEKGDPKETYMTSVVIDRDPAMTLGEAVRFDQTAKAVIDLPDLEPGDHEISLGYRTDHYSHEDSCTLTVTVGRFMVHAEVNTGSSTGSAVLVSLVQGRNTESYSISVMMDGSRVGFLEKVDFRTTPIASIPLPLMRPGEYGITVIAGDGRTQVCSDVTFTEPLRHPEVRMEIGRNPSTGKTRFRIIENPYGLHVSVHDSLVVRGRCDYHRCSYIQDRVDNFTEYRELRDIADFPASVPANGRWHDLTDTDTKERLMQNQFIANTTWKGEWSNSGDGGFEYVQVPDGVSYFKVESSTHHMTIVFEKLSGITVSIANSERDVEINGTAISTKHSYKL